MLLTKKGRHRGRNFAVATHGREVKELPARELRPVGKVGVLGQRVILPSAGLVDATSPPNSGGSIEIEPAAGAAANGLLDDKVSVEENSLSLREQRLPAVPMGPLGLNHA